MARAGQFGRSQAILERYLEESPRDDRAHLLLVQVTTEQTNAHPDVALAHVGAIKPDSASKAALLRFLEGKAQYQRRRYDLAETCWTEALRSTNMSRRPAGH